ncbi:MAG: hypothetical protein OEU26_10230 [Candidatus Tectomicrobia bacterium]|nr:hypothetical protein [Candidatus Tectomicrobia bacterium]
MAKRHCAACHKVFEPHRHVPKQQYCSAPDCQKVRRHRWQQHKLKSDPDYRDNQARAQRQWQQQHPDYWRTYRQGHPDYTARNRNRQRQRNQKRRHPQSLEIAKMDAYRAASDPISGTYWLVPVSGEGIAKMDAYMVELAIVSTG